MAAPKFPAQPTLHMCKSPIYSAERQCGVQARQMGAHAAHSMAGMAEQTGSGFTFELFAHVTRFVGKKVVLLGQYNGQRLEHEPEADMISYSRITQVGPPYLSQTAYVLKLCLVQLFE